MTTSHRGAPPRMDAAARQALGTPELHDLREVAAAGRAVMRGTARPRDGALPAPAIRPR